MNTATCAHDWQPESATPTPGERPTYGCTLCGARGRASRDGGTIRALVQTQAPANTTFGTEDRLGADVRGERVTVLGRDRR